MMNWFQKLDKKIGRFAIPHLMVILSAVMLGIYLADLILPEAGLSSLLVLDRERILHGEVWRLITFVFLPPSSSPIWIVFSLYFNCLIGEGLEGEWGRFKFNLFYLCGMIGAILASFLTGYGTNTYLNLSLFLAFAAFYPDFQVRLFFFLPVKIKYLAFLDILLYLYSLIMGTWSSRAALLMSLLNILLFFGSDLFRHLKQQSGYWKTRYNFRKYNR